MLFSPFPVFSRVCTPCQQHTLPHSPLYIQCYYRYTFANSGEKVLTFKTRIFSHSSSVNSLSSCILFKRNSAILYRTSFAPPSIISPPFSSRNLRTLNSFFQAKHPYIIPISAMVAASSSSRKYCSDTSLLTESTSPASFSPIWIGIKNGLISLQNS